MDVLVLADGCELALYQIYTPASGYHCICDFEQLPARINKQLGQEHRKASFLGLLAATLQEPTAELSGDLMSRYA